MSIDLSQYIATGVPYIRILASINGDGGVAPIGWRDLPQVAGHFERAYLNASIEALTIDINSDWPWCGVAGPGNSNLGITGPQLNSGYATIGSPILAQIISADATPGTRTDAFTVGASGANIAAISYDPTDFFGSGYRLDPTSANFYQYWDPAVAAAGIFTTSNGALLLRATLWFAPLPPLGSYPLRRINFTGTISSALTGGGATDIVAKIPMFGRFGMSFHTIGGTAGDTVIVKGVSWRSTVVPELTILQNITVPASGIVTYGMVDNYYDAIEVSVTHAGGAGSIRFFADAWDA
jgi:hypothetical protein